MGEILVQIFRIFSKFCQSKLCHSDSRMQTYKRNSLNTSTITEISLKLVLRAIIGSHWLLLDWEIHLVEGHMDIHTQLN